MRLLIADLVVTLDGFALDGFALGEGAGPFFRYSGPVLEPDAVHNE